MRIILIKNEGSGALLGSFLLIDLRIVVILIIIRRIFKQLKGSDCFGKKYPLPRDQLVNLFVSIMFSIFKTLLFWLPLMISMAVQKVHLLKYCVEMQQKPKGWKI